VASITLTMQASQRSAAAAERERQEAALAAYLDHITQLMVEQHLKESAPGSAVREAARARTLAALRRVNTGQQRVVLRFLEDAGLIDREAPVIGLHGLDLVGGADAGAAFPPTATM
jgi:hypothetical protein